MLLRVEKERNNTYILYYVWPGWQLIFVLSEIDLYIARDIIVLDMFMGL